MHIVLYKRSFNLHRPLIIPHNHHAVVGFTLWCYHHTRDFENEIVKRTYESILLVDTLLYERSFHLRRHFSP